MTTLDFTIALYDQQIEKREATLDLCHGHIKGWRKHIRKNSGWNPAFLNECLNEAIVKRDRLNLEIREFKIHRAELKANDE